MRHSRGPGAARSQMRRSSARAKHAGSQINRMQCGVLGAPHLGYSGASRWNEARDAHRYERGSAAREMRSWFDTPACLAPAGNASARVCGESRARMACALAQCSTRQSSASAEESWAQGRLRVRVACGYSAPWSPNHSWRRARPTRGAAAGVHGGGERRRAEAQARAAEAVVALVGRGPGKGRDCFTHLLRIARCWVWHAVAVSPAPPTSSSRPSRD